MNPQDLLTYAPRLVAKMKSLGLAKAPTPIVPPVVSMPHKLDPQTHAQVLAIIARACVLGGMTTDQLMGRKTKCQNTEQSKFKQLVIAAIRRRTDASYGNIAAIFGMSPGGVSTCEKYGVRFSRANPKDRIWNELLKA